jgi:hypothetical protein
MFRLKISPGGLAGLIAIVLVVTAAGSVLAQHRASDSQTTTASTPSDAPPPKVLTGKERLGEKWTDEQRVDNCKVPVGKRGARPRPDVCSNGSQ